MRKRLTRSISVIVCAIFVFALIQQTVYSAANIVTIYVNGQQLQFDHAQPVVKNGRTLVPFRKLFETLGFEVEWIDRADKRQAIGTKGDLKIALTINSTTAQVNGNNVTLDVPAQIIDQSTMVPLRFVSENSGYKVSYTHEGNLFTIHVGDAGGEMGAGLSSNAAEPYVMKGRVVDSLGEPIVGIKVYAENQFNYLSFVTGVTDQNGYYRIELPPIATSWDMSSTLSIELEGQPYSVALTPHIDEPFGTHKGAVRNFTYNLSKGTVYVSLDFDIAVNGDGSYSEERVELILIPLGPSQLGGSGGELIQQRVNIFPEGRGLQNIPVGRYMAAAQYIYGNHEPLPMLIRQRYSGDEYAEAVEFDFLPEYADKFFAKLEVLPLY